MTQAADPRLVPLRDALCGMVLRGSSGRVAYHLRECIGEGGQGWVFRANWDDPGGVIVIVKVLRPDAIGTESLRRFQREAEVLRMLSTQGTPNPYVVRFYDHSIAQVPSPVGGEPLAMPFTVLEYVHGPTLEKVLADSGGRGLAVERVRRLGRHVVQALETVHAQKVVHRDLKPSNILLASDAGAEIAKVTDFGLVKLVDVNLQRTAALAGASLGYAPPEQYEQGNQRVSPRTDVFSLAAVLYEMLSGKPAFPFKDGENPLLIVTRILNGPRPSLSKARDTLPNELAARTELVDALDAQIKRAMSADPAERHESVTELWANIEPHLKAAADEIIVHPRSHGVSPFEATARASNEQLAPSGQQSAVVPKIRGATPLSSEQSGNAVQSRAAESTAANPAAWTWAIASRSIKAGTVRAAAFAPSGERAIAAGPSGMARWERGVWVQTPISKIDPRAVRGAAWLRDGDALLFGERALVAKVSATGNVDVWHVPDRDVTFLGAYVEDGMVTLVGDRPYRGTSPRSVRGITAGVIAQFTGDRLTLLSESAQCTRLSSVTRLQSGSLVACGEWGAIVRLEMGVAEFVRSICGGHLFAIERTPNGGAVTIGAGGHALGLSAKLDSQLEAVQTTRDLLTLAVSEDGIAWAGSAQARILRRAGGNWVRMSGDVGITPNVIEVWANARTVRAVCDDGAVMEGQLT